MATTDPVAAAQAMHPSTPAPLDVERLARAMHESIGPGRLGGYDYDEDYRRIWIENATDLLAEYARLGQPVAEEPS